MTVFGAGFLIVFFQNCDSGRGIQFSTPTSYSAASTGGSGYDGKIYTTRVPSGTCPDGSVIQSKIVLSSPTTGKLVRANCQDIAAIDLTSADFSLDLVSPNFLIYQGGTFTAQIDQLWAKSATNAGEIYYSPDGLSAKVGIGTLSPKLTLQVEGTVGVPYDSGGPGKGKIGIAQSGGVSMINYLWADNGLGHWVGTDIYGLAITTTNGSGADIAFVPNNLEAMRIRAGGNVGIGTANPSYKLDVQGTIRGYGVTDSSDARLKKDVINLDPQRELDRLSRLHSVSYLWNDPAMGTAPQLGFIAQDMERLYPELVATDAAGYKSVNYSHLVSPLVAAAQALRQEGLACKNDLQDLRKQNTALKEELANLKTRLERIEAILQAR